MSVQSVTCFSKRTKKSPANSPNELDILHQKKASCSIDCLSNTSVGSSLWLLTILAVFPFFVKFGGNNNGRNKYGFWHRFVETMICRDNEKKQ